MKKHLLKASKLAHREVKKHIDEKVKTPVLSQVEGQFSKLIAQLDYVPEATREKITQRYDRYVQENKLVSLAHYLIFLKSLLFEADLKNTTSERIDVIDRGFDLVTKMVDVYHTSYKLAWDYVVYDIDRREFLSEMKERYPAFRMDEFLNTSEGALMELSDETFTLTLNPNASDDSESESV